MTRLTESCCAVWELLLICFLVFDSACALREYMADLNTTEVMSACLGSTPTLNLSCPVGQMVLPVRVFYGHSWSGQCRESVGDCTLDVPDTVDYPCVGRNRCEINLPPGRQGKIIPKCNEYSTYIQVHFICVAASSVNDICEEHSIRGQSGYVATPGYPNNYPASRRCNITFTTPYPSQRVHVWIIDLNLEVKDTQCADFLHVFDGYRGNTLCNQRSRTLLQTSGKNFLDIRFISDHETQRKGFWLYFEATPFIASTTAHSTPLTSDMTSSHTLTETVTITASKSKSDDDTLADVPLVVLLGVIFGIVLCTLVTILLVLIIRRRRSHCKPSIPASDSVVSSSSAAFLTVPHTSLHSNLSSKAEDLYYKETPQSFKAKGQYLDHGDQQTPVTESLRQYDLDPGSQANKYYKQRDLHLTIANTCYSNSQYDVTPDDVTRGFFPSPKHDDLDLESVKGTCKKSVVLQDRVDHVSPKALWNHHRLETTIP